MSVPPPHPLAIPPMPPEALEYESYRAAVEAQGREWWRWHFAGQAMASAAASHSVQISRGLIAELYAADAVNCADALIAELEKVRR